MKLNKASNRLELLFNDLEDQYKYVLRSRKDINCLSSLVMYLQGFSKADIENHFGVLDKRRKQYIYTALRKLKNSSKFISILNTTATEILKCMVFNKRYIKLSIEKVNLISVFHADFMGIGTYLYEKKYRKYIMNTLLNNGLIKIESICLENDFNEIILDRTKIKGVLNGYIIKSIKGYIRYKAKTSNIIIVDQVVDEFKNIFKQGNKRAIASLLERQNDFLIKVSKEKFIFRTEEKIKLFENEIFPNVSKVVYEEGIYSFSDIKNYLTKNNFNLSNFPGDSIYYITKELHFDKFNFSKKNSKLIYPKYKKVLSVSEVLKKKFPEGIGIVNLDELFALGFSKTIFINNKELWNNLYLSKNSQEKLIKNFKEILSSKKHIYYYDDLLNKANKELKLYLKNMKVFSRLKSFANDYFLLEYTFIKLSDNYKSDDYKEILNLITEYAVNKFIVEDYTKSNSVLYTRFKQFFDKNDKYYDDVLKNMYETKKITNDRKKMIKNYFWKQRKK